MKRLIELTAHTHCPASPLPLFPPDAPGPWANRARIESELHAPRTSAPGRKKQDVINFQRICVCFPRRFPLLVSRFKRCVCILRLPLLFMHIKVIGKLIRPNEHRPFLRIELVTVTAAENINLRLPLRRGSTQ